MIPPSVTLAFSTVLAVELSSAREASSPVVVVLVAASESVAVELPSTFPARLVGAPRVLDSHEAPGPYEGGLESPDVLSKFSTTATLRGGLPQKISCESPTAD